MSMLMRVNGAWLRLLTEWLDREGLAAPGLRARVAAHAPDDPVPLPVWNALLHEAATLRPGQPGLGLDIGDGVQPRHVGVLGYLVLASDNLGEAVATYQRYERLFYGLDLAEVQMVAGEVEIRWPRGTDSAPLADEVAIAALISFLRRQLDDPPPPSRVSFLHPPEPGQAEACAAFFGCPVVFGDSHTRVCFPASYLAMPMPHRDPGLRQLLDQQAQALLAALPQPSDFDRAVQQLLVRLLPEGEVSVDKVARALHQSTRTLQRRLADRGMSWQQLLDRTREQLARQYLRDPGLSLAEIGLLLGYSEQSAFTRAFRRWTGQTPQVFRMAQQQTAAANWPQTRSQ